MSISYNDIPADWRLPLVHIELDPSQAGTPTDVKYALLADYKIAAGTATANEPVAVGNVATAKSLFGAGSPLARAYERFFAINRSTPIFCLPIAEPGAGVQAAGDLTVTAGPTAAGTLSLYIAGQKVDIGLTAGMTVAQVATAIDTAVDAATDLPVTSSVALGVVTLTCKWKGQTGNDIRIEANYLGINGGEKYPAGLALTFPASNVLAGGTGVPDWTNGIAALGDEPYEFVCMPHTDTGSISTWDTEYGSSDSGRWGWLRQTYGHVFSAKRDTYANLMTYGPTNNSMVISIMAVEPASPTPMWEWAAAYTARAARALTNDPARPLQTLRFDGVKSAPKSARWSKTEVNAIGGVGLAVQMADSTSVPVVMREQTTYQKNTLGVADNAYELVTTLATLACLFRRMRQSITNKYPRHKLANNGTRFGPGMAIVTPNIIKAELVAEYRAAEWDGLVENANQFKAHLIVERNADNPNRIDVLYPPDLVNQLRMFAVLGQFRLQYREESVSADLANNWFAM